MRSNSDPPYRRKSIYSVAHEYDRRMIVVQPSKRIERHQTVPPADEDHAGLGLLDELVVGEQLQDFPRIHLFRGEMLKLRKWISLLPPQSGHHEVQASS